MACPRCETEESIGAKYCGGCGRRVQQLSCQRCGTGNPPTSRFCHECGHGLADERLIPPGDTQETSFPEDTDEVKDSAFWEAYADRTGIPAAGLIEVAPVPEVARRRHAPRRQGFRRSAELATDPDDYSRWRRQRHTQATLPDDRERRPVRIVLVAGAVLVVALLALFLSAKFWPAGLGPEHRESVAPPDGEAIARQPLLGPVPALTVRAPALEEAAPAPEIPAPPPQPSARQLDPASGQLDPPEPSKATTPGTSVERMATFLVERDGPERALQTALAVATFYPANSDDFKYWHRVAAAIRASTAPNESSGEAVRR